MYRGQGLFGQVSILRVEQRNGLAFSQDKATWPSSLSGLKHRRLLDGVSVARAGLDDPGRRKATIWSLKIG